MSKKLYLAGAAVLALAMVPQAGHAASIATTVESTGALPGYTAASVFQNFNGATGVLDTSPVLTSGSTNITQSTSGSNSVFSNSAGNLAAAPFLSGGVPQYGNFLSIGADASVNGATPASYTLTFSGAAVHFLSFIFSTLDTSNQVTLNILSPTNVASALVLQGNQILTGNDASGTAAGGTLSSRVSYNFGDSSLQSITFAATNQGTVLPFEIDEIALAAPEPATWAMMLLGFGLVGSQLRRRNRKVSPALATA